MGVLRIRGGSGLGDSLYIRPVADHFIRGGHKVHVMSKWQEVFIGSGAEVYAFSRENIQVLAHYVLGKRNPNTNQWEDVCAAAGVPGLPLSFKWTPRNGMLIGMVRQQAKGRPVVLVHGGRTPMDRVDGFGKELLPDRRAFDAALDAMDDCFLVSVGKADQIYPLKHHLSLHGQTTVADLIDLGSTCDGIVGQCSWVIPLAEAFDRPLLTIWADSGLRCRESYISAITPKKVLSKPSSRHVMDNWEEDVIRADARIFAELCGAKCAA